ncbi:MAG: Flp family type IVb pilin [Planctomycetes bacterium B3_Pla]|nr:MAG: Flp family type IVb pilin [Planctomycetes bacterium B3_Pla]
MKKVTKMLKRFVRDEQGLETVEYAIILGLIVVGTIGAIMTLGGWVLDQFQGINTDITTETATT